jgi:hypothetical protein
MRELKNQTIERSPLSPSDARSGYTVGIRRYTYAVKPWMGGAQRTRLQDAHHTSVPLQPSY